ncbi:hypothetical protein LWC34_08730 [Kibdelosporangium philippinense]|uniref:Peptidase C39-like domain-containing protein n=1 Tax=Kibdelosporangium philippinense TaxID=211113 RepID=A0ABS8Z4R8_9PSEU|nr:hypothetical protein [Kibdelosporangium philippinense]MCE7002916.1 hypothetical protein [Kibdelosporangium philippinense]
MRQAERLSSSESDEESASPVRGPGFFAAGNQAISRLMGAVGTVVQGVLGQEISGSVGIGGENKPGDIAVVIRLLASAGYLEPNLGTGIRKFQQEVLQWSKADGRVDPDGRTFKALKGYERPGESAESTAPGGGATPMAPATSSPPAPPSGTSPATAISDIEAELDALEALGQQATKRKAPVYQQTFEEKGPERAQLVERIGAVRAAINGVQDATQKATYFRRLNAIAPFYTQAANAGIVSAQAAGATCNVTVVAMCLEHLGMSADDYQGDWETMRIVEDWAQRKLSTETDFERARLADFMQLVATVEKLGGTKDPTDERIEQARLKALYWIAKGNKPLQEMFAKFGVRAESVYSPQQNELHAIGKKKTSMVWEILNKRQAAERKGATPDIVAAGRALPGADADEASVPLEGYKEWALSTFGPILDAGMPVAVGQYNHWMRLQSVDEDYVIVDDPGGTGRLNRKTAWEEARGEGLFHKSLVIGN